MKKENVVLIIGGLVLLSLGGTIYNQITQPKVAYVHVQEVYNDFEYKKELEEKFEIVKNSRKRILDSLEIQINVLAKNIQNSEVNKEMNTQNYQYLVAQYQNKQKVFMEDNEAISQKYTAQIWTQLNKYIEEFGEINDYDFIHGADGSGNVMYASKKYNQTKKLKDFVNERYQGGGIDGK